MKEMIRNIRCPESLYDNIRDIENKIRDKQKEREDLIRERIGRTVSEAEARRDELVERIEELEDAEIETDPSIIWQMIINVNPWAN